MWTYETLFGINKLKYNPHSTERAKNRDSFLGTIKNKVSNQGGIYVLVSPAYDIFEGISRDLGNELISRFPNVKVSRSPYRHLETAEMDIDGLCKEANGSNLVVYLAHTFCDHYIYELPSRRPNGIKVATSNNYRHGHHIVEAGAVARHLGKPLFVGYLDDCTHEKNTHTGDEHRLAHSGIELNLFHIGGSSVTN